MELEQSQYDVLARLGPKDQPVRIPDLAAEMGLDQSPVTAACGALAQHGLAAVEETEYEELTLGKDAQPHSAAPLPERVIVGVLAARGGACKLTEIPNHCPLSAAQVGQALRWLTQRGWAAKSGEDLVLGPAAAGGAPPTQPDERLLSFLADGKAMRREQARAAGIDVDAALELLGKRKGFLNAKIRTDRRVRITDAGRALLAQGVRARRRVTQLTPDLLAEGGWREVELQPYDVTLAAKKLFPGKEHPFQRTLDKVRRVFLEMGFGEIVSPWVESSFWDFDALFQPQDHPARDMQDTFYVSRPDRCRLPDEELVRRVQATHESGGDTGSTGWRYRWDRELAHKPVLRTHTTAATIRALAHHAAEVKKCEGENVKKGGSIAAAPDPASGAAPPLSPSHLFTFSRPSKYFVIGPVFRRETVDYKHLPFFHQVDGIIVDPHASLATLLGTLRAFYGKMGFDKVQFRPSFFPYTEPSAEVFIYLEERGEWMEMGGSGIFRPEVTLPLGISERVLAWGLGLERLGMMIHGLKAIGDLYFATMPWLREAPLRRA